MFGLIIFLFACHAMASIIIDQKIFEELRAWINQCSRDHPNWFTRKLCQMMHCYFCTGFWCGVVITLFLINPFSFVISGMLGITFLDPILGGLIGATFSYYFNLFSSVLEKWAVDKFNIEV